MGSHQPNVNWKFPIRGGVFPGHRDPKIEKRCADFSGQSFFGGEKTQIFFHFWDLNPEIFSFLGFKTQRFFHFENQRERYAFFLGEETSIDSEFSGWWFQWFFIFNPILGEMIQFDLRIFVQMGWKHQLVFKGSMFPWKKSVDSHPFPISSVGCETTPASRSQGWETNHRPFHSG